MAAEEGAENTESTQNT